MKRPIFATGPPGSCPERGLVIQEKAMIDCHKCRHYYVTWEKEHPHGCRAIGFKTYRLPSVEVKTSSGRKCLYFELKRNVKKK